MKVLTGFGHLSDEAMLLLQEDALHGRDARRAGTHLRICAACRARYAALSRADAVLRDVSRNRALGETAGRKRLQAALEEEASRYPLPMGPWRESLRKPRVLLWIGAAVAVVMVGFIFRYVEVPKRGTFHMYHEMGPRPNPRLTPGSVDAVAISTLCAQSDSNLDPQLSPDRVREVYRAYGINTYAAAAYQVDYLINPQLGGNDRLANLWPEPYRATLWNADAKDELERRLHGLVCRGDVRLADAQHDIADDWIGAYKKYLHTDQPLSSMALNNAAEAPHE